MKTFALLLVSMLVIVHGARNKEEDKVNRKGRCPQLIDVLRGKKCTNPSCKSDLQCPGTQKCCLTDCNGHECMEPIEETPETRCDISCTREFDPVCGTDDLTYPTYCMLTFTVCSRNQPWIKKAYDGPCKEESQSTRSVGPCKSELMLAEQQALIGSMRPQCDESGSYKARQCHPSTGYCWCADSNGVEISKPSRERPTEEYCQQLRETKN